MIRHSAATAQSTLENLNGKIDSLADEVNLVRYGIESDKKKLRYIKRLQKKAMKKSDAQINTYVDGVRKSMAEKTSVLKTVALDAIKSFKSAIGEEASEADARLQTLEGAATETMTVTNERVGDLAKFAETIDTLNDLDAVESGGNRQDRAVLMTGWWVVKVRFEKCMFRVICLNFSGFVLKFL